MLSSTYSPAGYDLTLASHRDTNCTGLFLNVNQQSVADIAMLIT